MAFDPRENAVPEAMTALRDLRKVKVNGGDRGGGMRQRVRVGDVEVGERGERVNMIDNGGEHDTCPCRWESNSTATHAPPSS